MFETQWQNKVLPTPTESLRLFRRKAKAHKGSPTWSWIKKSDTLKCWEGRCMGFRANDQTLHLYPVYHTVWPR